MIKFIKVSKTYGNERQALRDINLELEAGSFTFLMGSTGSGKSTLIKLLYREEVATSGDILVFGKNVRSLEASEVPLLRQQTGVVFQDFKLLPQRTVFENVAFALEIMGTPRRDIDKRVRSALELTGLAHVVNAYPGQLSGGEQQRVSVARAIINKPTLLLADEPTGNLDPETSWEIIRLLMKVNHSGTTVLVSTHNKTIVNHARKRVIKLDKGSIVEDLPAGARSGN